MNKKTKAYLSLSITLGLILLSYSIYKGFNQFLLKDLLYWLFLAGLSQSFLVVFNKDRYVSVVFAIIFAVQLIYGTYYSVVIAAGSQIFFLYRENPNSYRHVFSVPLYKTLFNIANVSISAFVSGRILDYLIYSHHFSSNTLYFIIFIFIYSLIYSLLNTSILMLLMSFIMKESFFSMWFNLLKWIIPNFAAIAPFGYFIYSFYSQDLSKLYIVLLVGPLLLARYSFQLYQESKMQQYNMIKALTAAIEAKDPYTKGHSRRVESYCVDIAEELKLNRATIDSIKTAALLHDVGKIGINDNILNKIEKLSKEDMDQIKNHPMIGVNILEEIELPKISVEMIRSHHERYDGFGYPLGLSADKISLESYILSAADAFDAMTSDRPYRNAISKEEAIEELSQNKGSQFHPDVVDAFIRVLNRDDFLEKRA